MQRVCFSESLTFCSKNGHHGSFCHLTKGSFNQPGLSESGKIIFLCVNIIPHMRLAFGISVGTMRSPGIKFWFLVSICICSSVFVTKNVNIKASFYCDLTLALFSAMLRSSLGISKLLLLSEQKTKCRTVYDSYNVLQHSWEIIFFSFYNFLFLNRSRRFNLFTVNFSSCSSLNYIWQGKIVSKSSHQELRCQEFLGAKIGI